MSHRIRETVTLYLAPGTRVAVISRGDAGLLDLADCRGEHFPQSPDGEYAGYHPSDSAAAIAHLQERRERGTTHLLIPASSFWWLEHYEGFATFLSEQCQVIAFVAQTCAIFALHPAPPTRCVSFLPQRSSQRRRHRRCRHREAAPRP